MIIIDAGLKLNSVCAMAMNNRIEDERKKSV
jgi:hypothetical protein